MEATTGDFYSTVDDLTAFSVKLPSLNERDGLLWDFARHLTEQGYVIDMKGYSACFRVNRKQQPKTMTDDDFAKLTDGTIQPWEGLATSVNLSCVDYYPATSGKKNWYVACETVEQYPLAGLSITLPLLLRRCHVSVVNTSRKNFVGT